MDTVFANAVASGAEADLIGKERFDRMLECTDVREVRRIAAECGFGGDAEDWQEAVSAEERRLCAFIRENAPSARWRGYLLAARDFYNAEAVVKARRLGIDPARMLGAEGTLTTEELTAAAEGEDLAAAPGPLTAAVRAAVAAAEEGADGLTLDVIFTRALFRYRRDVVPRALARYERMRADATNILTALRAARWSEAAGMLVEGGVLDDDLLRELCEGGREAAAARLALTDYDDFVADALAAAAAGRPFVDAERRADGFALAALKAKRFEPTGSLPFVLYCLDRENEIKNVRVIAAGVAGGADKAAIRARLREIYES